MSTGHITAGVIILIIAFIILIIATILTIMWDRNNNPIEWWIWLIWVLGGIALIVGIIFIIWGFVLRDQQQKAAAAQVGVQRASDIPPQRPVPSVPVSQGRPVTQPIPPGSPRGGSLATLSPTPQTATVGTGEVGPSTGMIGDSPAVISGGTF